MRGAFVDKSGGESCSVGADTGKKGDEFAATVLLYVFDSSLFIGLSCYNTLGDAGSTNEKSLLIPIVDIFSCDVVFRNSSNKLHKS
jgi:hypothetical protein